MTRDNRSVLIGGLIALALCWSWVGGCCLHAHYHAAPKQTNENTTQPVDPDRVLDWAIGDLQ